MSRSLAAPAQQTRAARAATLWALALILCHLSVSDGCETKITSSIFEELPTVYDATTLPFTSPTLRRSEAGPANVRCMYGKEFNPAGAGYWFYLSPSLPITREYLNVTLCVSFSPGGSPPPAWAPQITFFAATTANCTLAKNSDSSYCVSLEATDIAPELFPSGGFVCQQRGIFQVFEGAQTSPALSRHRWLHIAFPPSVPVESYYVEISSSFDISASADVIRTILVAVFVPVGILILLVFVCVVTQCFGMKRRKKSASVKTEIELEPTILVEGMSNSKAIAPSQEYVLSSDVAEASSIYGDLRRIKTLGSGNFGEVFLAQTQAGDLVAVKKLNPASSKEEIIEQHKMLSEAELMIRLPPNPNLVQILGIRIDSGAICIIMELCSRGSVDKLLQQAYESHVSNFSGQAQALMSEEKLFQLIFGTICGLEALAAAKVAHNDIAARNLLLDENGSPKLSDFGCSSAFTSKDYARVDEKVPVRWSAPEVLGRRRASEKSDVWSLGALVIELVTAHPPYATKPLIMELWRQIVDGSAHPLDDFQTTLQQTYLVAPEWSRKLMKMCLKYDPSERPTFKELREFLEAECSLLHARYVSSDSGDFEKVDDEQSDDEYGFTKKNMRKRKAKIDTAVAAAPRITAESVELGERLGSGRFGEVFVGMFNQRFVAVKVQDSSEAVLKELAIMSSIPPHPNVITFFGYFVSDGKIHIVTELASHRSLDRIVLKGAINADLPEAVLYRWTLGIARGMEHLSKRGIVHRDLSARNILMTKSLECKVTDFGLSQYVAPNQVLDIAGEALPFRHMSPESFDGLYSEKSDVWSFGATLIEIISGNSPYYEIESPNEIYTSMRAGKLNPLKHLQNKQHYATRFVPLYIFELLRKCFKFDPTERPTFSEIINFISSSVPEEVVNAERKRAERLRRPQLSFDQAISQAAIFS